MGRWPLLILIAIAGCGSNPPASTSSTADVEEQPFNTGEVDVDIGAYREVIAPPGSVTAGSPWIEHAVTCTNNSGGSIWVFGHFGGGAVFPHVGIESRADAASAWKDYALFYCGTGARYHELAPGASIAFTASLPATYAGQQFRVSVPYRTEPDGQDLQAASEAREVGGL